MSDFKVRKITNPGRTQLSINLDTTKDGQRESLILAPRQVVELTEEQFQSREVRKLHGYGYITDMTAADARRKERVAQQKAGRFPGF